MNVETIIQKINAEIKDQVQEVSTPAPLRVNVKVAREKLLAVLQYLKKEFGFAHMATISGVDLGENFEVVYHMASHLATVNVRVQTPRSDPRIPSTCSVIPGAILYERELQDMFGLVVENIPDPRPLLLADDWPAGEFPLRKDWHFNRPAEIIPGGK